jgi:hypothetical protein
MIWLRPEDRSRVGMRRYRAKGWQAGPWTTPSAGAGVAASRGASNAADPESRSAIQILELPVDPGYLPQRVRLTLVHSTRDRKSARRRRHAQPTDLPGLGEIVEDRLDGRRIYAEPPRRNRVRNRRQRLAHRVTLATVPFLLLAWAQVLMVAADAWSAGAWNPVDTAAMVARAAYLGGLAALPAAVLMWRPDALRSAPLVLLGAVVWTVPTSLAGIAWWSTLRAPGILDLYGHAVAVAVAVSTVVACFGPVLVAYGMERVRHAPASWYSPAVGRLAILAALAAVFNVGRWVPLVQGRGVGLLGGGMDTLHLAGSIAGAVEPIFFFSLLALALSAMSAVSADEAQHRLWRGVAVGTAVLAGVSLYQIDAAVEISFMATAGQNVPAGLGGLAAMAVLAAGAVSVVAGYSSPVWSRARDAEGWGRGAPEEIFAWGSTGAVRTSDPIPMATIVAMAAGADHALAVDSAGRVGGWGDNSKGQTDVPEGLAGVSAVAAGDGFSVALRADGTVVAWGDDGLGQTRVPEGLSDVTAVAAGGAFTLALRADGTVVAWGDERSGAVQVPERLAGVIAVAAGMNHALALKVDGSVVGCGDDKYGQATVPGIGRARAISAGACFSLALLADGSVMAWGDGRYGQLDIPSRMPSVAAISAGAYHALALLASGDVVGWGGGNQGQGEATHPWHLVDFKAVAGGDGFSVAIRAVWSPLSSARDLQPAGWRLSGTK